MVKLVPRQHPGRRPVVAPAVPVVTHLSRRLHLDLRRTAGGTCRG